jgi:hypothetical protein
LHSESSIGIRGQKRSLPDANEASPGAVTGILAEPDDGLKVWGYMPGHVHYKVGAVDDVRRMVLLLMSITDACNKGPGRKDSPAGATVSSAVDEVLHAIPPRTITGVLLRLSCNGLR